MLFTEIKKEYVHELDKQCGNNFKKKKKKEKIQPLKSDLDTRCTRLKLLEVWRDGDIWVPDGAIFFLLPQQSEEHVGERLDSVERGGAHTEWSHRYLCFFFLL